MICDSETSTATFVYSDFNTCIYCLQIYPGIIWQCPNGHVACELCSKKLKHCGECKDTTGYNTKNLQLMHILAETPVECVICQKTVAFQNFNDHLENCQQSRFTKYSIEHPKRICYFNDNDGVNISVVEIKSINSYVNKKSLRNAGFVRHPGTYNGHTDAQTCKTCGIIVAGWEDRDIPQVEHFKNSPFCTIEPMRKFRPFAGGTLTYLDTGDVLIALTESITCGCPIALCNASKLVVLDHPSLGKYVKTLCSSFEEWTILMHRSIHIYEHGQFTTVSTNMNFRGNTTSMRDSCLTDLRNNEVFEKVCSCGRLLSLCKVKHEERTIRTVIGNVFKLDNTVTIEVPAAPILHTMQRRVRELPENMLNRRLMALRQTSRHLYENGVVEHADFASTLSHLNDAYIPPIISPTPSFASAEAFDVASFDEEVVQHLNTLSGAAIEELLEDRRGNTRPIFDSDVNDDILIDGIRRGLDRSSSHSSMLSQMSTDSEDEDIPQPDSVDHAEIERDQQLRSFPVPIPETEPPERNLLSNGMPTNFGW